MSQTWSGGIEEGEPLKHPVMVSALAHAALLIAAIGGAWIGHRDSWGEGSASGSSATVKLVSSASVPLPPPAVPTTNKVANEDPALHFSEAAKPQRQPVPEKAIELPGRSVKKPPPKKPPEQREEARLFKPDKEIPQQNEIPLGAGGPAQGPYGMFRSQNGSGGFVFDQSAGDFGSRFGWYVTAIRQRISGNWLQGTIDPSIQSAPRVFVTFQILRDGNVVNAQMTRASDIPSLDRSVLRAVLDSSPMPELPADFRGSSVAVEFWFDFKR